MKRVYTVLGVYEDDADHRYATHVEANSPDEAERLAIKGAPNGILVAGVIEGNHATVDRAIPATVTSIKGRGYTTKVATLHVSYEETRLPLRCPKCHTDFRKAGALEQTDYWDYDWKGRIPRGEHVGEFGVEVDRDQGAKAPADVSATVPAVVLICTSCRATIWNGYTEAD